MSGLSQGALQRRVRDQCQAAPARTALHIPTNHQYRVVLEIEGIGVELENIERRCIQITWAAWSDHNIWRCV